MSKSTSKVTRKRKTVKTSKVPLTIKKYVKKTFAKNVETKSYISYNSNISINTASTSIPPVALNLLPSVQQGLGKSQRVANEISVTKAVVKGRINLLPYNVTTNPGPVPMLVKAMIVSNIQSNSITPGSAATWANFFEVNNGSANFQSTPIDMYLPYNREVWRVYASKTFKIGAASITSTGPVGSAGYYDNSPMSVPFSFSYAKHIRKLKYDDTTNTATNHNLYLIFQAVNADGTTTTLTGAEHHTVWRVDFKDA